MAATIRRRKERERELRMLENLQKMVTSIVTMVALNFVGTLIRSVFHKQCQMVLLFVIGVAVGSISSGLSFSSATS